MSLGFDSVILTAGDWSLWVFTLRVDWPVQITEAPPVNFNFKIANLRQLEDKSLLACYERTSNLLTRVGGKDRPRNTQSIATSATTTTIMSHTPLENAMFDTVLRVFVWGLNDPDVRRDTLKGLVSVDWSLLGPYSIAEECRRVKAECARLHEEVAKM